MKSVLAWLLLALLAPGQVKQTQTTQDRNLIVGAWSLSSYELRLKASGTITTPFGPHPVGRILYEANGQMSAQLMRPEMTAFASDDPLRATDEEAALAWRNYIGYLGHVHNQCESGHHHASHRGRLVDELGRSESDARVPAFWRQLIA
jgi:hypothetical protein